MSRQTVYDDLRAQGIDPSVHRRDAIDRPRHTPLTYEQIADLAEHMSSVLLPSMLASKPEPLAVAAWMAKKALNMIAELLKPELPADDPDRSRAAILDTIADCGASIRRAAHEHWASEATQTDLARFTEDAEIANADVGIAVMGGNTAMTVLLPDGMTPVLVTMSTAGLHDPDPDGWTTWNANAPLPLAPIDGFRHLEITSLLESLRELITQALHPELLEDR